MNNNHDAACMMHLSNETIRYWIMRIQLITLFIVLLLGQLNASSSYGQKVTIEAKRQSLERVLKEIKKQSGFDLIYNPSVFDKLAESVTVSSSHTDLQYVLSDIFKKQSKLEFLLNGKTIIVRPRGTSKQDVEESTLSAQQPIRGRVTNEKGEPLAGASIYVLDGNKQRTATQANTDTNGNFELKDITEGQLLEISYLGHRSVQRTAKAAMGNIVLQPMQEDVEEVIVNAGYYTVKNRERTGSIARVTAKDIEFQPVLNPLQAIQGRMAGVSITQNTGVAGGGFDVQIRGRNSLSFNGNTPLYIIDGVPLTSEYLTGSLSLNILNTQISPLNAINPSDIQSIEVLKDADATAIYGSKGANGVVLITTKQAYQGRTTLSILSTTSISKVANKMKLLDTKQFNHLREEAYKNDKLTSYPINAYDLNGAWERNRYTDWQKELIGNTAVGKEIQVGLSGGSHNTSFKLNTGLADNSTVFPTEKGYKRNTISFNINHRSTDSKLKANIGINYSEQKNNLPSVDLTTTALTLAPNAPSLYNEEGALNWQNGTFQNPLAQLEKTYSNQTKSLSLNTNIDYNIFSDIHFKLNLGLNSNQFMERRIAPHTIFNPSLGFTSERSTSEKGDINSNGFIAEPQLNWNKSWDSHSFILLLGGTFESQESNSSNITGVNFSSNALINNIESAKEKTVSNVANSQYKYAALFSRLNYTYDDKYILNLTARRDGSSRFGDNNRFGNFGALGFGWILTEEEILKDIQWLTFAKFRTTYGITGSDNIGNYQYLDTYTVNNGKYDEITGLYPSKLYNPDFGWEKTVKFEIALELSLIRDRINTGLTYYHNKSSNQLVGYSLPWTTGFSSITSNFPATVVNKGWEISINTNNIHNNGWDWRTSFNISLPKNKLKSFENLSESTYKNRYIIGKSIDLVKLYHLEGINQETGRYEFTDYNKDGKLTIDDKQIVNEMGVKFHGGLQNTIAFRNFSFDFLFHFVNQHNYNYDALYKYIGSLQFNLPVQMLDTWTIDNREAHYTISSTGGDSKLTNLYNKYIESDRVVSDASFIRLKNASISYKFKSNKKSFDAIKVYVQGQNLWTRTNYYGLDPEFVLLGFTPPLRTYAFGAQINF